MFLIFDEIKTVIMISNDMSDDTYPKNQNMVYIDE